MARRRLALPLSADQLDVEWMRQATPSWAAPDPEEGLMTVLDRPRRAPMRAQEAAMTFHPGMTPPIRVFICDDLTEMRLLLRATLHVEMGILLIGEADDGITAIRGIQATK